MQSDGGGAAGTGFGGYAAERGGAEEVVGADEVVGVPLRVEAKREVLVGAWDAEEEGGRGRGVPCLLGLRGRGLHCRSRRG